MIRIRNVLVATDFSEPSAAALQYGREFARTFNAGLLVLHVADLDIAPFAGPMYVPPPPDQQREVLQALQLQVEGLLTEEDRTVLHGRALVVTALAKAEAIVSSAQEHAIDIVVIGTHGRSGLGHLLMGSVAERVVRTATCPVLTVHRAQHDTVVADGQVVVDRG